MKIYIVMKGTYADFDILVEKPLTAFVDEAAAQDVANERNEKAPVRYGEKEEVYTVRKVTLHD